ARLSLEKLILDGRIHPARIEETVEKARNEVDRIIKQEGERAMLSAGVHHLHPELVKLLGKLHFRTSYGQNVLDHSLEVCYLAGLMAAELGEDVSVAKRAGLLHDIGKALDHEREGSHIQLGVEAAKKCKEHENVVHAIHAHHGDIEAKTVIACLVQAADAISAARPGARRENIENYIKRLEKLEEIANSFEGVEGSFAIQAGREIRIMVKPDAVDDDKMVLVARDIVKQIEENLEYPGQIKVNVIRENRVIDYAK
ncbi:MAG: HDIG domain-containing protein, partial [bacterium]|nr:HDIG domain-containing protein [bacterium]